MFSTHRTPRRLRMTLMPHPYASSVPPRRSLEILVAQAAGLLPWHGWLTEQRAKAEPRHPRPAAVDGWFAAVLHAMRAVRSSFTRQARHSVADRRMSSSSASWRSTERWLPAPPAPTMILRGRAACALRDQGSSSRRVRVSRSGRTALLNAAASRWCATMTLARRQGRRASTDRANQPSRRACRSSPARMP